MSFVYRAMYRLGATPWDNVPTSGDLVALVEGPDALPAGAALDLGCGTGRDVVYLAKHGWKVTGVDAVPLALRKATARVEAARVTATVRRADITRDTLGGPYSLFIDIGCLHNLGRAKLAAALNAVDRSAAPGATLLAFAFEPGGPKPGPVGFTANDLTTLLPGWELVSSRAAPETPLQGRMKAARPHMHRLVKR